MSGEEACKCIYHIRGGTRHVEDAVHEGVDTEGVDLEGAGVESGAGVWIHWIATASQNPRAIACLKVASTREYVTKAPPCALPTFNFTITFHHHHLDGPSAPPSIFLGGLD